MKILELERNEIDRVWSLDRSEVIERIYRHRDGRLVLEPERHDVRGWPVGEPEHYGPILADCLEHGGSFFGAFEGDALAGVAVLERRFIGRRNDRLQLKFLHTSRASRGTGVGAALFEAVLTRARELGARQLYISATPSENTIGFYLRRGCRVTEEVDAELFALEPEDIHLERDVNGGP